MKARARLSPTAQIHARDLGYSPEEVLRVARLARPVTDDWWTHRYENLLFRKGDHVVHDFGQEGDRTPSKKVSRHLLISARDSINDLLLPTTPPDEASNARWVLNEIEKELQR